MYIRRLFLSILVYMGQTPPKTTSRLRIFLPRVGQQNQMRIEVNKFYGGSILMCLWKSSKMIFGFVYTVAYVMYAVLHYIVYNSMGRPSHQSTAGMTDERRRVKLGCQRPDGRSSDPLKPAYACQNTTKE